MNWTATTKSVQDSFKELSSERGCEPQGRNERVEVFREAIFPKRINAGKRGEGGRERERKGRKERERTEKESGRKGDRKGEEEEGWRRKEEEEREKEEEGEKENSELTGQNYL